MPWIVRNIRWIMVLTGGLTTTMLYATLFPQAALRSTFDDSLSGPLAEVVVRNWGAMIAMIGFLLLYGAFVPAQRNVALVMAGVSKATFITLVLLQGEHFLDTQAAVVVVGDAVMVLLYAWYLVAERRGRSAGEQPAAARAASAR